MVIINVIRQVVMRLRIKSLNANRLAKVQLAKSVRLDKESKVHAYPGTSICIGENVYLRSNPNGYHTGMPFPTTVITDKQGASITIGDNCRLNGVYVHAQSAISIGANCVIAAGVNIIDSNGHQVVSFNRTNGRDDPKSIKIGNNVWIGMNAIILKGTEIGDNCVIAAGTVVKGVFPKNKIIHNQSVVCDDIQGLT